MSSELKVYNRFGELSLHLRLSVDNGPDLRIIDGTPDMRAAISSLRGVDFDRTVAKNNELLRFVADWGSADYLSVLGRYFVENFGWSTKIVETQPSTASRLVASSNLVDYKGPMSVAFPVENTVLVANVTEDRADLLPTAPTCAYAATP